MHACSVQAQRLGVRVGMTLSAALAVSGGLETLARNPVLERETLDGLAEWAYQFSSMVTVSTMTRSAPTRSAATRSSAARSVATRSVATRSTKARSTVTPGAATPQVLLIEVGGSLRLLAESPQVIGRRMRAELRELGFEVQVAMAPTPLAAEWLARCGVQTLVRGSARLRQRIGALPVDVLTDEAEALDALEGIGVRTVEEVARLPRAETTRRLRLALHQQLDRALGRVSDPREPHPRRERLVRELLLPVPVSAVEALLFALGRLLRELMGVLVASGAAVQETVLTLDYSDRGQEQLVLRLMAPSRDVRHLLELARHRLEKIRLIDSVERIGIEVLEQVELAPRTSDLFETGELSTRGEHSSEWFTVLERLNARMGSERVRSLASVSDHRPECAWRLVTPGDTTPPIVPPTAVANVPPGRRPLWLLIQPEPLSVTNGALNCRGTLCVLSAPERIESGWWDERDVRRDYHVAINDAGERYWIFRDLAAGGQWYLHGIFA